MKILHQFISLDGNEKRSCMDRTLARKLKIAYYENYDLLVAKVMLRDSARVFGFSGGGLGALWPSVPLLI